MNETQTLANGSKNTNSSKHNGKLASYKKHLPFFVIGAVFLGSLTGIFLREFAGFNGADIDAWKLGLPGDLFLRLLKMVVIPLIIAAIIGGVVSAGDLRKVGKLGVWTTVFYLGTTAISVAVGLFLVNLFSPGVGVDTSLAIDVPEGLSKNSRSFGEFMQSLVSANPIGDAAADLGDGRLLPLLLFCVLFGGVLTTIDGPPRKAVEQFIEGLYQVMMKITDLVILLTPIGVFFLLVKTMATFGIETFKYVGWFGLTVVTGLLFHAFVVLPLLLKFLGRQSPIALAKAMFPALLTAFSTCSSSASLPVTLECATKRGGIPKRIVNFIVPLGATVNMDGTALYEAVAAIFIAQAYGIELTLLQQATVLVMATLAAVGTAGIPSASLVMIAVVLSALGLPLEGIGLIMVLDRLLDMCRTTVNVWGDASGAAIYYGLEKRVSKSKI